MLSFNILGCKNIDKSHLKKFWMKILVILVENSPIISLIGPRVGFSPIWKFPISILYLIDTKSDLIKSDVLL